MEEIKHTALTMHEAKNQIAKSMLYDDWDDYFGTMALNTRELNASLEKAAKLCIDSLTSQLSSALESYNRECKRNDQLHAEVEALRELKTEGE
jgi:hypothetical protein